MHGTQCWSEPGDRVPALYQHGYMFIPLMLEVSIHLQQLLTSSLAGTMIPLGMGSQTQQEKAQAWLLLCDPIMYPVTVDLVQ